MEERKTIEDLKSVSPEEYKVIQRNKRFEELARKRLIITGIFTSYFGAYTKVELLSRTEDKIKQDILEQINEQMSLGKISGIYLTDYIFIE